MLRIIEFVNTDLPEPVVPATSICGIFARLPTIILPSISLPTANVSLPFAPLYSLLSISSLKATVSLWSLGTSIPTAALPGTGASILTLVAARLRAISSDKPRIFETLTPAAG